MELFKLRRLAASLIKDAPETKPKRVIKFAANKWYRLMSTHWILSK